MNKIRIGNQLTSASQLVMGCMRLAERDDKTATAAIEAAREIGINFFDHSDVYADGESERKFAQIVKELNIPRDELFIQTKCGLRDVHNNYHFDSSKDYIIQSAEASLRRLGTDYVDVLLIHRPDALVDPEEVAEAFHHLHQSGKVRYFGVSNHNSYQIDLLQQYVGQPLIVNQLQFGPAHTSMLDAGLNSNMKNGFATDRDGGVLDYCRLNHITIQPWSPFQVDLRQGLFVKHPDYQELTETITSYADQYGISFEAMVIAWILRHPARMQPIVGSINPQRILSLADACDVELSRADWYRIYKSGGNPLP